MIYDQIDNNKKKTWLIMSGFILIIFAISAFFAYYFNDNSIVVIALIVSIFYAFFQYFLGAKMAIMISGAKEVTDHRNEYYKVVENLSITTGLPMPKVYIIDDPSPNAFATGRDPEHASVCATTGILEILNKRELEGVMAHEMSHVGNYDIKVSLIAFALSVLISVLADIFFRISFRSSNKNNKDKNPIILIFGIISIVLAPFIATIIRMALSRNREYLADSTAALTTRDPEALASALEKINLNNRPLKNQNPSMAGMYINNPLKKNFAAKIFSTHPPIEDRILRLRAMVDQQHD